MMLMIGLDKNPYKLTNSIDVKNVIVKFFCICNIAYDTSNPHSSQPRRTNCQAS